jgi:steroid 5-alpha reductase family enzyme
VDVRTDGHVKMSFLVVSSAALIILIVTYGITFVVCRRIGRYNVVDVTWGVSFVVVAAVAAVLGDGDLLRRLLLLVLVAVWGLRLAWHMVTKSGGKGEDPRYDHFLKGDFSALNVLRKIFAMQTVAAWFISLPLQLSAVLGPTPLPLLPVLIAGVLLWLVGASFEAIGDRQLHEFKAAPAHRGLIMDRGLWAWLITISGLPSLSTVLSPAAMTYFLVYATGARPTERIMADRPGFREYCSRTSFFVPRPPRSRIL